jgi:hypothetical protein
MNDLPCLCAGTYRCNQCRARDWEQTCDCAHPYRCPQHRGTCTCRANQPCDYHSELERERVSTARRMQRNRYAAANGDASPVETRQHQQTSFEITPTHWVVARPGKHGTWDVVEIVAGQASRTHAHHRRRAHAEVVAAAIAATRTHHTLTAEDTR